MSDTSATEPHGDLDGTDSEASSDVNSEEEDALLSRLHLIEDQPLAERAVAFSQIHDGLQSVLEGGDAQQHHG
jgi:hypothetical protein